MAKTTTGAQLPAGKSPAEEKPVVLQPSKVTEVEDPGKTIENAIQVGFGEVLLVSLDTNGQETGNSFKVSTSTYSKYYRDETKFRLKKNHE